MPGNIEDNQDDGKREGIEIDHDNERGYLHLACEPDAFAAYRDLARQHLEGIPDIDIDKMVTIEITDTASVVRRRDAPSSRFWSIVVAVLLVLTLSLAVIGAISLLSHLWHYPIA